MRKYTARIAAHTKILNRRFFYFVFKKIAF
mgnify:CR=1 FL=1